MNKHRFTALLLALLLLALPALSLGEDVPAGFLDRAYQSGRMVKTTITFLPGEMMAEEPSFKAVADLFNVLRIETFAQEQGDRLLYHMEVFLQDKSSLSADIWMDDKELHIATSLLRNQTFSFTLEEFWNTYLAFWEESSGELAMDDRLLQTLRASLATPRDFFRQQELSFPEAMGLDTQSFQQDLAAPMAGWFSALFSDPVMTEGTFESDRHDPAVVRREYTVSVSQLKAAAQVFSTWLMQDVNLERLVQLGVTGPSGASYNKLEIRRSLMLLPNEFEKGMEALLQKPIALTEYTNAKGERKATEVTFTTVEGENADIFTDVAAGEYIKTEADGVMTQYRLHAASGENHATLSFAGKALSDIKIGDTLISGGQWHLAADFKLPDIVQGGLALDFTRRTASAPKEIEKDWTFSFGLEDNGSNFTSRFSGTEKTGFDGTDAVAEGTVAADVLGTGQPLFTLAYTTASAAPRPFPTVSEDGLYPLRMTLEELEAWEKNAATVMTGQMLGIVANLPTSIQEMIFNSQGWQ